MTKESQIATDGKEPLSLNDNQLTFPQIKELHDDILVLILEFVAEAPYERSNEGKVVKTVMTKSSFR